LSGLFAFLPHLLQTQSPRTRLPGGDQPSDFAWTRLPLFIRATPGHSSRASMSPLPSAMATSTAAPPSIQVTPWRDVLSDSDMAGAANPMALEDTADARQDLHDS